MVPANVIFPLRSWRDLRSNETENAKRSGSGGVKEVVGTGEKILTSGGVGVRQLTWGSLV